jgi:hypothetical protein
MVTRGLGNRMSTRIEDGRGGRKIDPLFHVDVKDNSVRRQSTCLRSWVYAKDLRGLKVGRWVFWSIERERGIKILADNIGEEEQCEARRTYCWSGRRALVVQKEMNWRGRGQCEAQWTFLLSEGQAVGNARCKGPWPKVGQWKKKRDWWRCRRGVNATLIWSLGRDGRRYRSCSLYQLSEIR